MTDTSKTLRTKIGQPLHGNKLVKRGKRAMPIGPAQSHKPDTLEQLVGRTDANAARVKREEAKAARLIDAALENGWTVSVNDGEAWAIRRSTDRAAILAAMFSTELDLLMFREVGGEPVGAVSLIYGNDANDLVADYSVNPLLQAVINIVEGNST